MRIRVAVILVRAANLISFLAARIAGDHDALWAALMKHVSDEELGTFDARAQNEVQARAAKQ